MGLVGKIKESLHSNSSKEVSATEHHHQQHPITNTTMTQHGNHLAEHEKVIGTETLGTTARPSVELPHHSSHHIIGRRREASVASSLSSSDEETPDTKTAAAVVVEKPMVVKEKHIADELTEVTPVIEKHIVQPEIHQTIKPLHASETVTSAENVVNPTITRSTGEEHQVRADVDGLAHLTSQLAMTAGINEVETAPVIRKEVVLAPIVKEVIHHEHIEQIQPVLTKDVYHQHVRHVVQPITEHVRAPAIVHEVKVLPTSSSTPLHESAAVVSDIQHHEHQQQQRISPVQFSNDLVAVDVLEQPKSKTKLL